MGHESLCSNAATNWLVPLVMGHILDLHVLDMFIIYLSIKLHMLHAICYEECMIWLAGKSLTEFLIVQYFCIIKVLMIRDL